MTVIRVRVDTPVDGGEMPADGSLKWRPTSHRVKPGVDGAPSAVVLPASFVAAVTAGSLDVEVEPSTNAWLWCVVEVFRGIPDRRRYFAVPDAASVDYTDLVEIDPTSLAPAPSADPAWLAPFNALSEGTVTPDPGNPGFYLIGA